LPYIGTAVAVAAAVHGQYLARKYHKLARGQKPLVLDDVYCEFYPDKINRIAFTVLNRNYERDITLHDAWAIHGNVKHDVTIWLMDEYSGNQAGTATVAIPAGGKKDVLGYFNKNDSILLLNKKILLVVRDCTFMQSEPVKIILSPIPDKPN
jgi:hypothetical protein